jgi:hypothetical protein
MAMAMIMCDQGQGQNAYCHTVIINICWVLIRNAKILRAGDNQYSVCSVQAALFLLKFKGATLE